MRRASATRRGDPSTPIRLAADEAGYARGAYALGYWGDTRDPIEIVRPDLAGGADGFGDDAGGLERAQEILGVELPK